VAFADADFGLAATIVALHRAVEGLFERGAERGRKVRDHLRYDRVWLIIAEAGATQLTIFACGQVVGEES
jgi:hypothetical protein